MTLTQEAIERIAKRTDYGAYTIMVRDLATTALEAVRERDATQKVLLDKSWEWGVREGALTDERDAAITREKALTEELERLRFLDPAQQYERARTAEARITVLEGALRDLRAAGQRLRDFVESGETSCGYSSAPGWQHGIFGEEATRAVIAWDALLADTPVVGPTCFYGCESEAKHNNECPVHCVWAAPVGATHDDHCACLLCEPSCGLIPTEGALCGECRDERHLPVRPAPVGEPWRGWTKHEHPTNKPCVLCAPVREPTEEQRNLATNLKAEPPCGYMGYCVLSLGHAHEHMEGGPAPVGEDLGRGAKK